MNGQALKTRRRQVVRIGLAVLAALDGFVGGWALASPLSFYQDFPGLGMHWVVADPPYNEHLVTDFGGALTGLAVALALAAVVAERTLAQVILIAALVQAVPHLVFHLTHSGGLPMGQLLMSRAALVLLVALPLALLWPVRDLQRL